MVRIVTELENTSSATRNGRTPNRHHQSCGSQNRTVLIFSPNPGGCRSGVVQTTPAITALQLWSPESPLSTRRRPPSGMARPNWTRRLPILGFAGPSGMRKKDFSSMANTSGSRCQCPSGSSGMGRSVTNAGHWRGREDAQRCGVQFYPRLPLSQRSRLCRSMRSTGLMWDPENIFWVSGANIGRHLVCQRLPGDGNG